jgi:iron complex outermembrane receptor protein
MPATRSSTTVRARRRRHRRRPARRARGEDQEDIRGTAFQTSGPTPVNYRNNYTDFLPNANMRIRFSPEWQLRLAATETRTRPLFTQLNPALRLDPPGCTAAVPNCARTGNGGNPFLRPLDSRNYDASLEYYFSRTGFATVAAFRRDMRGFIATNEFQFPDPDPETGLPLRITGPVNTERAGSRASRPSSAPSSIMPACRTGYGGSASRQTSPISTPTHSFRRSTT